MPCPAMATVEVLSIDAIELSHSGCQPSVEGLHHQMVMIVHQTVGIAPPAPLRAHLPDQRQERLPIRCIAVDLLARIAPGSQVVHSAGELYPQGTSHARRITDRCVIARPDPI